MYDVITVGSATVDALVKTEFCEMLYGKNKEECVAYPTGSKILIEELKLTVGGGGTNTAVALAKLGHNVAFLGKIGTHENSKRVMESLKKVNVSTSLVIRAKSGRTGYSIILDSLKHDRTILNFRGSNNNLKIHEVPLRKLKTKWFYFSSMIHESFHTLEKLADYAEKNRIKVAFNTSSYLARRGKKYLGKILRKIEILILNYEEAQLLVGKSQDMKTLLDKIQRLGPRIVAITDGNRGVYVIGDGIYYRGHTNNVKVAETTGAGDAFASTFLSGMIRKENIEFALKLGMANAESVIQKHGAKEGLLSYNKAMKAMKYIKVKKI
jgi:ribokinase